MYWISKILVRYILLSAWLRLSQFFHLYFMQHLGLCLFRLTISLMMIVRICALNLIIIIESELWPICHCSRLGHETMVCAVWLSIFLSSTGIYRDPDTSGNQVVDIIAIMLMNLYSMSKIRTVMYCRCYYNLFIYFFSRRHMKQIARLPWFDNALIHGKRSINANTSFVVVSMMKPCQVHDSVVIIIYDIHIKKVICQWHISVYISITYSIEIFSVTNCALILQTNNWSHLELDNLVVLINLNYFAKTQSSLF